MYCRLIITRYPKYIGMFGFISMALFRLPLYFYKKIRFFKLMGSGRNGTFDIHPDLNQWAVLFTVPDKTMQAPSFMYKYWRFFNCDIKEILLQPMEGHGFWDKKKIFGELDQSINEDEPVAVLTRATIRLSRLKNFWKNVAAPAAKMNEAEGLILSYGIGEVPWIKQATFSIWKNRNAMKAYAYKLKEHAAVIKKTRSENWYKEEMFVRFRILGLKGYDADVERKLPILQPSNEEA